jgi:acyl-CoA thioester hydrolase
MACEFRYQRRVEFSETDLAGIVHFSNFFRYMETTEHAFLRSLGLCVHGRVGGRLVSWPRVHAECKYESPLMFEEEVEIHLLVRHKKRKTLTYDFRFTKLGAEKPLARGSVTVVCATIDEVTGKISAIAIPEEIDRRIEVAPAELLHGTN